ncbi:MAG: DNA-3-methyladenine glycosylase 2 family protein [SAR86 cluster bacterium]|uniref:DNA-3-methyladenine glycosylase 2 family protein n=1 Tax=SAR86 cluster bacterium TaxID=2030880 RepID=A0A937M2Z4_9GAMM|nr:DNA-3-methyladenine glycosylase 2 family protein [SAR86 cluster bacterium]
MDKRAEIAYRFIKKQSKKHGHSKFYNFLSKANKISLDNNKEDQLFFFLIKTIISQQVSTIAARTIWGRLRPIIELNKDNITEDVLRSAGISRQKAAYILGILNNKIIKSHSKRTLKNYSQDELSKMFIEIKGIGPWTIGITRMFYICDEDVWLDGDLGINKALKTFLPNVDYKNLTEIYSPYRTYLSLYLWKGLDSF